MPWGRVRRHMDKSRSGTVLVLAGKRTGFGGFGGTLRHRSATDLGAASAKAALEEARVDPESVEHTFFGNVLQTSPDAIYLARHVGLRAGVPENRPALTVNRLCGSGFEAIAQGAQAILTGDARVCLVGGAESMSQAPHVVRGARWGELRLGPAEKGFGDSLWEALLDSYCGLSMAETAEELADRYDVTREQADQVALTSQRRAAEAWRQGFFEAELTAVSVRGRRGVEDFAADEHLRPETTAAALAKLRPYFRKNGVVTAGNASGIGDGAAAAVLAGGEWADAHGLKPLGRIVSWAFVGVEPKVMGIGPAPAARLALERAGLAMKDMDLVEVNEAFAAQYKAVEKELGLDPDRTNVNGGAIALSHPLAASGARITIHLLHELRRRGARFGLGSACIGGGQGGAMIVEAL